MGIDHSNPYIHSTTVLCDNIHSGRVLQRSVDRFPNSFNTLFVVLLMVYIILRKGHARGLLKMNPALLLIMIFLGSLEW